MIVKDYYVTRSDGVKLFRTHSDSDKIIRKVGTEEEYTEAIDIETAPYTYEETDKTYTEEDDGV